MRNRFWLTIVLALGLSSLLGAVAPQAPQRFVANVNGNTVTLTWSAPATGGAPSTYIVEASVSPGGAAIAAFSVATTSLAVTSVPNGVYYVRVRAVNADGTSAPSNEVTVVVPAATCFAPPDAPVNLAAAVFGQLVTLDWTAPAGVCAATAYAIQVGSAPGATNLAVINVGATTTFSASAPAGVYYARVVAMNVFGISTASNEVVITVTNNPPNVAGQWTGTSNYFNAPFTFDLTQSGSQIGGRYVDRNDQGFVSGVVNGTSVVLDVNFGDTGIRFEGTIQNANRIRGTIRGGVIGGTYNFEMTR